MQKPRRMKEVTATTGERVRHVDTANFRREVLSANEGVLLSAPSLHQDPVLGERSSIFHSFGIVFALSPRSG